MDQQSANIQLYKFHALLENEESHSIGRGKSKGNNLSYILKNNRAENTFMTKHLYEFMEWIIRYLVRILFAKFEC